MGYLNNPGLEIPGDETVIWRYMELPKLLSMLEQRSLYFSRLSELGDAWEGVINRDIAKFASYVPAASGEFLSELHRRSQACVVNCWYCEIGESVAMWKLYTSSDYGVAIRSTVGSLKLALEDEEEDIFLGMVMYRDHTDPPKETLSVYDIDVLKIAFQKRTCYRHECELRAVALIEPDTLEFIDSTRGVAFPVRLQTLIQSITTGPRFPGYAWTLLDAALRRGGLKIPISESNVLKPPTAHFVEP
jgi:hypothetical protein